MEYIILYSFWLVITLIWSWVREESKDWLILRLIATFILVTIFYHL